MRLQLVLWLALLLALVLLSPFLVLLPREENLGEERLPLSGGCVWKFERYEASEYETLWVQNIQDWQNSICSVLTRPEHQEASLLLLRRLQELVEVDPTIKWPETGKILNLVRANKKADSLMSRFYYVEECPARGEGEEGGEGSWKRSGRKGVQLIEPLWGMLRDPFDRFCEDQRLKMEGWHGIIGQSKQAIMPQGYAPYMISNSQEDQDQDAFWSSHGLPPWVSRSRGLQDENSPAECSRHLAMDFGSSYFGQWLGDSSAASGQWLYKTYHIRKPLDHLMAIELSQLSVAKAYQELPIDLVGKFTLINAGVSLDEENHLNVFKLIESYANEKDFLIIKLDIDSPDLEQPLVDMLRQNQSLANLLDEFLFEHHVNVKPMIPSWGANLPHDMAYSYKMFRELRELGIRAHSWP
jgi:hypothetical protein